MPLLLSVEVLVLLSFWHILKMGIHISKVNTIDSVQIDLFIKIYSFGGLVNAKLSLHVVDADFIIARRQGSKVNCLVIESCLLCAQHTFSYRG